MKDKRRDGNDKEQERDSSFAVIDRRSSFEGDTEGAAEPRLPTYVEELKKRAEEAESRAREISAAYRNIEQERDAFRERLNRDLERRLDIARSDVMRKVLGVLDDLDRALAAPGGCGDPDALVEGVTLIRDHLQRVLTSEGVEIIETAGKPFDPSHAEAVAIEETDQPERDNFVAEEFQKGYMLGGTLLRPARVKVARRPRQDPGGGQEATSPTIEDMPPKRPFSDPD
ncbi:MAG: nucleotide exchange factor GrpE [Acidobacteriota bacterium]